MVMMYKQCLEKYGSVYRIQQEVAAGRLFKLEKGVYSDKKYESVTAIVSAKYPKAVFTMDSAFYFYGLTDTIPEKCHLATARNTRQISDSRVVQRFENSDTLYLGAENAEFDGATIFIYNRERMLLELLRNKNSLPFDYYKEFLGNYRKILHELDSQLIQDYLPQFPKSNMINQALQLEVF
jgi:predicted transcriptional regulator of viral defense system